MRLLVLGGTVFLGRAIVESALAGGHDVTLFNRGRTSPELFREATRLVGDRERDLGALEDGEWDAVVDVHATLPRVVRASVEALGDRVGRYVFVSTVSVYADLSVPPDEESPVAELADPDAEEPELYGALKAASERIVVGAYGERALIVRPGLIVGPYDPSGRFTYWPHRAARGGTTLAPGEPGDLKQFVDVRDLAEWIVRMAGREASGVFNATGRPLPFGELLEACRAAGDADARFAFVPSQPLVEAGVRQWTELPLWLASPEYAAMQAVDVTRALAAGLTFRPLAETVRATLELAAPVPGVGLDPGRERELLERLGGSDRRG